MNCPRCHHLMTDLLEGKGIPREHDWTCLTVHDDLGREIHKLKICRSCSDAAIEALTRNREGA